MTTTKEEDQVNWKTAVYKALRASNDVNAVKRGKVPRRVARRAYGKLTGRAARRLFR